MVKIAIDPIAVLAWGMNRRRFMQSSVASGLTLAVTPRALFGQAATVMSSKTAKPVVIASANGNKFKNGGEMTCVQKAFTMMTQDGADVLDALIAGVNIVELDPLDDSVGYGGLPNAEGVVQLDSCCMHGPKRRAGGVACIEGVRTPSLVAKAVMEQTDHHLIVGKGAQDFARGLGFKIEDDLNTEKSRKLWLDWKRRIDPSHYLDPQKRAEAGRKGMQQMVAEGLIDAQPHLRDDQLRWDQRQRRDLRRHHHERTLVENSRAGGRFADPRRGPLCRWRSGRRRFHRTRRGEPLQPVLVSDRREHAQGHASERCRNGGVQANQSQHRRKAPAQQQREPELRHQFLHLEREGRIRRRVHVSGICQREHKEVVKITYAVCTEKGPQTLPCERCWKEGRRIRLRIGSRLRYAVEPDTRWFN